MSLFFCRLLDILGLLRLGFNSFITIVLLLLESIIINFFYLYLMSTDRIRLNPRIEGEIRHRSVAKRLQILNPSPIYLPSVRFKTHGSDRIGLDRFYESTDSLCTPIFYVPNTLTNLISLHHFTNDNNYFLCLLIVVSIPLSWLAPHLQNCEYWQNQQEQKWPHVQD